MVAPLELARLEGPVVAIVNPGASRLKGASRRARILADLDAWGRAESGHAPEVLMVDDGPSIDAAGQKAIRAAAGLVVAVGGDGTIAAITVDLAGTGIPIAIVPAGTGNVLANALGIPDRPARRCGPWSTRGCGRSTWVTPSSRVTGPFP